MDTCEHCDTHMERGHGVVTMLIPGELPHLFCGFECKKEWWAARKDAIGKAMQSLPADCGW